MFKTLTAGITALSLAVPHAASAQSADISKLIAGLAAVALIGVAIDQGVRSASPVALEPLPRDRERDRIRGHRTAPLPAQCRVEVPSRHGVTEIYASRCMARNYERANRLPEVCNIQVQGEFWGRTGYAPDCLRQFGYVEERQGRSPYRR